MIRILQLLGTQNVIVAAIMLAFIALGIGAPFYVILKIASGSMRRWPLSFKLGAGVVEEIVFRLLLLGFFLSMFDVVPAVLMMTAIYAVYSTVVYGVPYVAEAIVTGILFSFAMFEIGFVPVLVSRIVYRGVFWGW